MTSASELSRLLLFCGHGEVADFLNGSPLNRHLYKLFLCLLPQHQIEVPMVDLFNEIYYQAVHIDYDATPGVDIENRYLCDTEQQLSSASAAQLVYTVLWVLLRLKPALTFNEECFQAQFRPYVSSNSFKDFASQLYEELHAQGIAVPDKFSTITCPVDGLPTVVVREGRDPDVPSLVKIFLKSDDYDTNQRNWNAYSEAWIAVTGHFSHTAIEHLVCLYDNPQDQCCLVEMIQDACPREDLLNHTRYFAELSKSIRTGSFADKHPETWNLKPGTLSQHPAAPVSINITIPTAHQVNINPQRVINSLLDKDGTTTNE